MIRAATIGDVPALIEMGMRFHSGSEYRSLIQPNRDVVRNLLEKLIEAPEGAVFVSEQGGVLTGAILGIVTPHLMSGEPALCELSWWVDPEHRGTAGPRLLKRLEEWGRERLATASTVTEPPGNPGVGHLYERMGYARIEATYMKAL